jgi:hypothetical protein
MDYGKSGAAKSTKGAPKFDPHKTPSKDKAKTDEKAALLDRMKAAADKKTSE